MVYAILLKQLVVSQDAVRWLKEVNSLFARLEIEKMRELLDVNMICKAVSDQGLFCALTIHAQKQIRLGDEDEASWWHGLNTTLLKEYPTASQERSLSIIKQLI